MLNIWNTFIMEKKSEIYVMKIDIDNISVGKQTSINICRNIYAKQQ
jgi:hypothetical protein